VVKCQILQKCFLQNFNTQKSKKNMEHSNSRTFKDLLCFQGLSRARNFFPKFKDFQGLLKDPSIGEMPNFTRMLSSKF